MIVEVISVIQIYGQRIFLGISVGQLNQAVVACSVGQAVTGFQILGIQIVVNASYAPVLIEVIADFTFQAFDFYLTAVDIFTPDNILRQLIGIIVTAINHIFNLVMVIGYLAIYLALFGLKAKVKVGAFLRLQVGVTDNIYRHRCHANLLHLRIQFV